MLMPYHSSLIADQKIRSLNQIISCRKRWVLQGILTGDTLLSQEKETGLSRSLGNSSANDRESQLSQ